MDSIWLRDLCIECIVGVLPKERTCKQTVELNLRLECDLRRAGRSDDLNDTVDYRAVRTAVLDAVQHSSDFLVERLAQRAADAALSVDGVRAVTVLLDKPGALTGTRSVAVEITRRRDDHQARRPHGSGAPAEPCT